jgi:hypothetical protein
VISIDGFETGDFAGWSATATDGGDLSVATSAALIGNYGMQATIDDNIALYATDWSPVADPLYQARFHFDPNSIGGPPELRDRTAG